jgi:hypothetical protein
MAAPRAVQISLSEAERSDLTSRLRRRKVSRADVMRAEVVLLAAEGATNLTIAVLQTSSTGPPALLARVPGRGGAGHWSRLTFEVIEGLAKKAAAIAVAALNKMIWVAKPMTVRMA